MPGTVVMKFGGTSVADAERIKRAAARMVRAREQGQRVVGVLSARGKTTDELIAMAEEVSPAPDPREMDMLLSTGERMSCALCAMAINDLGHRAISLTGSQAGIVTDTSHTKARILDVRADRIHEALEREQIVLVAGFQGVSTAKDVTTLGRGGSDTTAVALAAALGADVCEIYTDVAGVYSADPRIVPDARKLSVVSFEEMLEMAASGAGVLQLRSVEYARNHGVRIHCRASFSDEPGTVVVSEEETMEHPLITAVTHSTDEARVTLLGVPDTPGVAGRIFTALADSNVNVDMIIQNEPVTDGSERRHELHRPARRPARRPRGARSGHRGVRHPLAGRPGDGQGLDRRRGHALAPRRRGKGLRHARRTRHQHRDDLHLADQDLLRRPRRQAAGGRARAARRLRARVRGRQGRAPVRERGGMRVAVVGATGAVGTVMLAKLREREFPADEIVPFASERSAGRELEGASVPVVALTDETIQGFDIAIFSAGATTSRAWAPKFVEAGATVVDNSSAFRQQDDIPLVVAEVNPEALDAHQGIIANPNCSTMELMLPAKAIHAVAGIERLIVSTYQCVSGTGVKAVEELEAQSRAALAGEPLPEPQVYPHPIAFNVLGGAGNFKDGDDYTDEERKMMFETRKILGDQDIGISVTCARVPVTYSHSLSVNLQTRDELSRRGRARRAQRLPEPDRR